jgi:hypothetical protein
MPFNYYRLRVKNPSEFKPQTFRTQDIGRPGGIMRITAQHKRSGKWMTQAWRISINDARVINGRLMPMNQQAKKVLDGLNRQYGLPTFIPPSDFDYVLAKEIRKRYNSDPRNFTKN